MDRPVRLAIDLGTTHTIAVVRRGDDQAPRTLLFDGSPLLSSAVFVDSDGAAHAGRDAQRLGASDPRRYEPHPKRRIDDGQVLLGSHEVPVDRLLAATLRRVADEARTAGIEPADGAVLTCPADWGRPRRTILAVAAQRAGLGPVRLLDEPIAAATYCVEILGQRLPPGGRLGIFDFGGGTLDVAVVSREQTGPRVLATGGLDDLGGLDVDNALVAHLGHLVELRDPALWQRLSQPDGPGQHRDRQTLWAEVRAAKEMLSRVASAPVQVPGRDEPMHLTRDELDRVAGPLVARAVDETRRVLQRAGVEPTELSGLLLVGGCSRLPLVASRLHARLGIAPSVPEQPELPVVLGAIRHASTGQHRPAPGNGPYRPPLLPPVPAPGSPSPGQPSPGQPSPGPLSPSLGGQPGAAYSGAARPGGTRRRSIRHALVVGTALVAVAGCVAGIVTGGSWLASKVSEFSAGGGLRLGGDPGDQTGDLTRLRAHPATRSGAAAVSVAGDQVISAVAGDGATEVVALPASPDGPPRWAVTVPIEPVGIRLTALADLIIIDGERSAPDGDRDVRVVLSTTDGRLLWKRLWDDRTDVAYHGTDAVVEVRGGDGGPAILRVNLRSGRQLWHRASGSGSALSDEHRAEPMRQWPATATAPASPASTTPASPPAGSLPAGSLPAGSLPAGSLPARDGVLADATTVSGTVVELDSDSGQGHHLDVATGKPRRSGKLPLDETAWTAFDGLAIGKQSRRISPGYDILAGYDVAGFRLAWTLRLDAGRLIERVKPCGQHLVCATVADSAGHHMLAVQTRTGTLAWQVELEGPAGNWYAFDRAIVAGSATFDLLTKPRVLGPDGRVLRALPELSTVAATGGGRFVLGSADGPPLTWRIRVEEAAADRATSPIDVGTRPPEQVAIGGDLLGVITADRQTLVLKISGLA